MNESSASAARPGWWQQKQLVALAWVATFLACVLATHWSGYELNDPDSRLYARLSESTATQPVATWAAPETTGRWSHDGYFYQHPPGMLWAGATMVRLGMGRYQAMYVVNFASFFAVMLLLFAIGRALGGVRLGTTAVICWIVTPSFMQYLVRGNQEHPMAVSVTLGVYALLVPSRPWARVLLLGAALGIGVLVKGIAGLGLIGIAGIWWLLYSRRLDRLFEIAAGCGIAALIAGGLEAWHHANTGLSFWGSYVEVQLSPAVGAGVGITGKLYNLFFYLIRPWWFFFPWIVLVAYGLVRWVRSRGTEFKDVAWQLGLVTLGVFIFAFSLAQRKAERYLFPSFPILALSAAWAVWHLPLPARLERVRDAIARRADWIPYGLMAIILIGVVLKIYVGTYHYSFIKIWPGHND
ncbi:MAG: glycosyltransferase family 39 protein [Myxococcota bacterium]